VTILSNFGTFELSRNRFTSHKIYFLGLRWRNAALAQTIEWSSQRPPWRRERRLANWSSLRGTHSIKSLNWKSVILTSSERCGIQDSIRLVFKWVQCWSKVWIDILVLIKQSLRDFLHFRSWLDPEMVLSVFITTRIDLSTVPAFAQFGHEQRLSKRTTSLICPSSLHTLFPCSER